MNLVGSIVSSFFASLFRIINQTVNDFSTLLCLCRVKHWLCFFYDHGRFIFWRALGDVRPCLKSRTGKAGLLHDNLFELAKSCDFSICWIRQRHQASHFIIDNNCFCFGRCILTVTKTLVQPFPTKLISRNFFGFIFCHLVCDNIMKNVLVAQVFFNQVSDSWVGHTWRNQLFQFANVLRQTLSFRSFHVYSLRKRFQCKMLQAKLTHELRFPVRRSILLRVDKFLDVAVNGCKCFINVDLGRSGCLFNWLGNFFCIFRVSCSVDCFSNGRSFLGHLTCDVLDNGCLPFFGNCVDYIRHFICCHFCNRFIWNGINFGFWLWHGGKQSIDIVYRTDSKPHNAAKQIIRSGILGVHYLWRFFVFISRPQLNHSTANIRSKFFKPFFIPLGKQKRNILSQSRIRRRRNKLSEHRRCFNCHVVIKTSHTRKRRPSNRRPCGNCGSFATHTAENIKQIFRSNLNSGSSKSTSHSIKRFDVFTFCFNRWDRVIQRRQEQRSNADQSRSTSKCCICSSTTNERTSLSRFAVLNNSLANRRYGRSKGCVYLCFLALVNESWPVIF